MNISSGRILTAQKVVVYGPEGIGKSTFASQFPEPLFIDTEGSTKLLDVRRFDPAPSSWEIMLEQIHYVKQNPDVCKTLVIDTADWAERMLLDSICAQYKVKSIEDFGYGKGYTYVYEGFGKMLNALDELIECGINVCITAHAMMRKFEQPDEMGAYDRWEMKLSKKVAPMIKEWADMVLFANYQTFIVKQDNKMLKDKVKGGKRVLYTTHNPCWDAKNRHSLPEQIDFDFGAIAEFIPAGGAEKNAKMRDAEKAREILIEKIDEFNEAKATETPAETPTPIADDIPKELRDLMIADAVPEKGIQKVVEEEGYYPAGTPISAYDPEFVRGWIVAYWDYVRSKAQNVPF